MNPVEPVSRSGRGWAYTGALAGGLVSIAANVAHSFIPPRGASAVWHPEGGAVVGAVVWPVFLFIAVEILARVAWPHGPVWRLVRWAGLLPVAVVAALVSYRHLSGLLAHYGEERIVYLLGPLAVDGLMVMATGALLATGRHLTTSGTVPASRRGNVPTTPPVPTNSVSVLDIAVPTPVGATVPPIPSPSSPVDTPTDPAPVPAMVMTEIPTPADVATRINPPATVTGPQSGTPTRSAARTRPPRSTGPGRPASRLAPPTADFQVTESGAAQLTLPILPENLLNRAKAVAKQHRTEHGTPITAGQLAARLRVNSDEAAQALALLDLGPDQPTAPVTTVNGNRPKGTTR
jgi:hypothetical protein